MSSGPLSHLRIIDITHYTAGPYCTKLMAGFGAEVIKIEKPATGDIMRSIGPFCNDKKELEHSIPFLWLNTGKKSITLNLKTVKGVEIFIRLVQNADAVIENFSPHVLPSLGLSYENLQKVNPRIIMTSISNFGQTGPYRDYQAEEIQMYAMSGLMYETGERDGPPLCAGPALSQYSAAASAYIGTLLALFQRETSGRGQQVDISIQEAAMNNIEVGLVECLQLEKVRKRNGNSHLIVPWQLYECTDGQAAVIGGPIRHWLSGAKIFGEPELLDKYPHVINRMENRDAFEALLKPLVKRWSKEDLFQAGQERRLAFGYLAGLDDVLESPQHRYRHFFEEVDHPVVGKAVHCNAPFKMSETSWQTNRAPLLGEHNQTIYKEHLGFSLTKIEQLIEEGVI